MRISFLAAVASATLSWAASTALVIRTEKKTTVLLRSATFLAATAVPVADTSVWAPRSRFWADSETKGMPRAELAEQMRVDIQGDDAAATSYLEQHARITKMHRNTKDNRVVAVEVAAALSEKEATRVQAMAESLRNHDVFASTQFEHRGFGPEKGGNDCTYLAPLLQLLMPELAAKVVSIAQLAWEEAGWGRSKEDGDGCDLSSPMDLGIRTSEHLSYDGWRSLEPHKDDGSIYTCNIALKEPEDYEGGEFFLHTSFFDQIEVKPQRLSATVFLSDTTHGVRPITSGSRVSFVTEFWEFDDAPLGMNRPTPTEWEDFLAKQ